MKKAKVFVFIVFSAFSMTGCFHDCDTLSTNCDTKIEYSGDAAKSEKLRDKNTQVLEADLELQIENNTDFAFSIFSQVKGQETLQDKNIVFSPLGISITMAMLSAGAENNTLNQINDGMNFNQNQMELHSIFNYLDLHFQNLNGKFIGSGDIEGSIAINMNNALWGQTDYKFEPLFLDTLGLNYGAGVNLVDFNFDPEIARLQINHWAKKLSNNNIVNAMPNNSISEDTRLVLLNSTYFKGNWLYRFQSHRTSSQDFFKLDSNTTSALFMSTDANFNYFETAEAMSVELDFVGNNLSMLMIMPSNYLEFENYFNRAKLNSIINGLKSKRIELNIPKYSITSSLPLEEALKAVGIVDLFDQSTADLSGIDGTNGLVVKRAIQKAFIIIDENGAESGTFTNIGIDLLDEPAQVIFNKPFLFFIRDKETNSILFFGRVLVPSI